MKYLIFDAGPLINLSINNLLNLLRKLKKEFKGEFLITKEVKKEVIDNPLNIKRFELSALQLKELFDEGIIKHADITEQEVDRLRKKRDEIMNLTNNMFKSKNKSIHIIDKGESAALALSLLMSEKTNQAVPIIIDERTARMLCENPENLRKLLEKKLKTSIKADKKYYDYFKNFKIIRSTELIYIASKKKLFDLKDPRALEAMLYGLKYNGCSISEEEVEEMKRL